MNPERVRLTQALTLNPNKPMLGLKGKFGLFGSEEWWGSVLNGKMQLLQLSGIVVDAYVAGQDLNVPVNTIDLLQDDGELVTIGIYVNEVTDVSLFRRNCRVTIVYALDELKLQPATDGGVNYSKIALEMAVQVQGKH